MAPESAHPALLPAAALLAGSLAGLRLDFAPVPLLVLLAAAGIALGGRWGGAVLALAVGLTAAAVAGGPGPLERVDPARPVEVVGRVVEHPRWSGEGWGLRLAVRRVMQRREGGERLESGAGELRLTLPGEEPPPVLGSVVRVRGRLSRSPGFANAVPVPPGPWRLWLKSRRLMSVEEPPGPVATLAGRWRGRVEGALAAQRARGMQGERAATAGRGLALVRALVLGDPGDVPEGWRRGLRRAGLAHLLAVSGLHVGLVAAVGFLFAFPLPWRWRLAAALMAVLVYLLVAGPRPSLLRAAAMGLLATAALLAGRPPLAGNALAVAAATLVLLRPTLVDDLGFRLTVSATAGLIFLGPPVAAAGRRLLRGPLAALHPVVAPFAASLGAQTGSLPFAAPTFHLLSLTAPLTNLLAVPATALLLAACALWTVLAVALPETAARCLPWLDAGATLFALPAAGGPRAWGTVALAAPAGVTALVAGCVMAAMRLAGVEGRRARLALLLLPLVMLWPAWKWGPGGLPADRGIGVTMLDVGQGDAVLLRDGERAVLVDGGGWRRGDLGGRVLLPALLGEGVDRLDAVVLTHPDRDHCGGLVDLASYLPVGALWTAPGWQADPCGAALVDGVVGERPSRLHLLTAGDERTAGRWRFTVLHPASGAPRARRRRQNDGSLVLRADALGRRLLLTGDVEAAGEREILRRWPRQELAADLLKVAHHGSRTSTSRPFLRAVSPRLALVSAGVHNPYHHPSPPVVDRLRRSGALVLGTHERGAVRVAWNGHGELRLWWPGR